MMNSSTYILMLVVFSASFVYAMGADMPTLPETPMADPGKLTGTTENEGTASGSETTGPDATGSPENVEDIDTSTTNDATAPEVNEARGNGDAALTGDDSCIEVSLPDVLGIGKCLGNNLDLCQNEKTLVPGVLSLVNCTVTSLFKNLSPQNALVVVKDILVALINKLIPGVARLVEASLARRKLSENVTIANNICEGEINIKIPNSLGKCLDNTLLFCEKGKLIDMSLLESLGRAVGCIVKDLFTTLPHETLKKLLCDVVKLVADLLGRTVKTAVSTIC
ncbi:uncharacterized protein LOC144139585 isoform X1 [Haemaphysalis longicornis]